MSTATINMPIHKPTAKKPPAAPAGTTRHAPASAEAAELPIDVEASGTLYDTVLCCTLDIEVWTSN